MVDGNVALVCLPVVLKENGSLVMFILSQVQVCLCCSLFWDINQKYKLTLPLFWGVE